MYRLTITRVNLNLADLPESVVVRGSESYGNVGKTEVIVRESEHGFDWDAIAVEGAASCWSFQDKSNGWFAAYTGVLSIVDELVPEKVVAADADAGAGADVNVGASASTITGTGVSTATSVGQVWPSAYGVGVPVAYPPGVRSAG